MKKILEVCVDSLASAKAAMAGGADRLELCSALAVGGLSPYGELLEQIKATCPLPVRCLMRPRPGDFLYTEEEIELMCDILKKTYGHTVLFLHAEWLHKHQVKVSESFIRHAGVHRIVRFSDEKIYADSDMRDKGAIFPVTVYGDWYGAFVIVEGNKALVSEEVRTAEAFAILLSRQQEH